MRGISAQNRIFDHRPVSMKTLTDRKIEPGFGNSCRTKGDFLSNSLTTGPENATGPKARPAYRKTPGIVFQL